MSAAEAVEPETILVDANGEVIEPETVPVEPEAPEVDDDPDQAEGTEDEDPEVADEPPAAVEDDTPSIEAQHREQQAKNKKLDQVAAHTAKRYGEILGSDLDGFVGCAMCAPWFPGIRLPIMPEPETLAAIKIAIGEDPDPPLHDDPYSRQCGSCGGHGVTKTNSHVTGQKSAQCLDCKGRGWLAVGPERDSNVVPISPGAPPIAAPAIEGFPPPPMQIDTPRTPAEQELRDMGAIVVWPPKPPQ
jgi:hypothetical protein